MIITVVGLGFVGLTAALGFAEKGFTVYGFDTSSKLRDNLLAGMVPFHEPGLKEHLAKQLGGNFTISAHLADALARSDVIMLCVGTPSGDDGSVDLGQIEGAIDSIVKATKDDRFRVVCVKSTVPPPTTQRDVAGFLRARGKEPGSDIGLANNPEFLREGFAWDDFMQPDRVVVGTSDERTRGIMAKLYEPFGVPLHYVDLNTAEYIKYLSNTLLATMISFSNEMSLIGHAAGVDIKRAFSILHEDKRWNGSPAKMSSYVYPGCGFGGYCLPKDTAAIVGAAHSLNVDTPLLESVLSVNEDIAGNLTDRIARSVEKDGRIAVLGLSFKPGSDDVRSTPAARVIEELIARGRTNIVGYDPLATDLFRNAHSYPIDYATSLNAAVADADAVVLATAWPEFLENRGLLQSKNFFDLRYFL